MIGRALAFGFLGWALENALFGPRYSKALGGRRLGIPFLPVYAAGGLAVGFLRPRLAGTGFPGRALAYGAALSGVELLACALDREAGGRWSWNYARNPPLLGCVDLKHALAWGVLGAFAHGLEDAHGAAFRAMVRS
jgi:hypothetical protein